MGADDAVREHHTTAVTISPPSGPGKPAQAELGHFAGERAHVRCARMGVGVIKFSEFALWGF